MDERISPTTRARLTARTENSPMKLTCYKLAEDVPTIRPAKPDRAWMDATGERFAYRCTPLSMANSTGWELLTPHTLIATWNGGAGIKDIQIKYLRDDPPKAWPDRLVGTHFGHGVLTFHPGYLFRTEPGWAVWCRGSPNSPKDGVTPLDGLVETDWLPFTFTMNWLFTRPCTVRFEKGEPFCFVVPVPHMSLENIAPEIKPLSDNPELLAEYKAWGESRAAFNARLAAREPGTMKEKWQRFYVQGVTAVGTTAPATHRAKRRMADPKKPDAG
jgi:hypothetical protein